MSTAIRALDTPYGGVLFRSRLEARWAVFFDQLGIKWEYEPQGFKLSTGAYYLPDFYLPNYGEGMWVEVKHDGNAQWNRWDDDALTAKIWEVQGLNGLRRFLSEQGETFKQTAPGEFQKAVQLANDTGKSAILAWGAPSCHPCFTYTPEAEWWWDGPFYLVDLYHRDHRPWCLDYDEALGEINHKDAANAAMANRFISWGDAGEQLSLF